MKRSECVWLKAKREYVLYGAVLYILLYLYAALASHINRVIEVAATDTNRWWQHWQKENTSIHGQNELPHYEYLICFCSLITFTLENRFKTNERCADELHGQQKWIVCQYFCYWMEIFLKLLICFRFPIFLINKLWIWPSNVWFSYTSLRIFEI